MLKANMKDIIAKNESDLRRLLHADYSDYKSKDNDPMDFDEWVINEHSNCEVYGWRITEMQSISGAWFFNAIKVEQPSKSRRLDMDKFWNELDSINKNFFVG